MHLIMSCDLSITITAAVPRPDLTSYASPHQAAEIRKQREQTELWTRRSAPRANSENTSPIHACITTTTLLCFPSNNGCRQVSNILLAHNFHEISTYHEAIEVHDGSLANLLGQYGYRGTARNDAKKVVPATCSPMQHSGSEWRVAFERNLP